MKQIRYVFALSTLLFGVGVMLFFALAYPHHLHFQEQYQLFLFNWSYVGEVLAEGGVADLVGRFLTQFFLYAWVGASVIALMMVGIQLLAYRVMRMWGTAHEKGGNCEAVASQRRERSGNGMLAYALSFIPAILCVCFLTDENALMTLPVAIVMVLGLALLLRGRKVVALAAVCAIGYIIFCTRHCYRTEDMPAPWEWVAVDKAKLQQKEEIMAYDFMARNAQWNRIIQRAQKRVPRNQVSLVALNLALSQRGMLTEYMFNFPQHGMAGLLPNYNKDSFSPLVTAEAFYRLGLINTAQRFVFEAQEAIPDFQKSARCYKRLAETNLINGQYEVARKYLNALRQTLYYRSWAEETLGLLSDEAVEAHPVYGELRRLRCQEDYFFGGNTPQQILVKQLEANPENRMAEEYLKATVILTNH